METKASGMFSSIVKARLRYYSASSNDDGSLINTSPSLVSTSELLGSKLKLFLRCSIPFVRSPFLIYIQPSLK